MTRSLDERFAVFAPLADEITPAVYAAATILSPWLPLYGLTANATDN